MASDTEKKGFAGLESMVSEIENTAPHKVSEISQQSEPAREVIPNEPKVFQGKPSSPRFSGKWWVFGIAIVIIIIAINNSGDKTNSRPSSYTAAPASAPTYSPTPAYVPPTYASTEEEMPPVGSGMSFNRNQIRYCLSEKIRVEAWQNQVNNYSATSVDAFNIAVDNYNSRCSNFRYRRGELESVRSEVEANRYALIYEGTSNAALNP